VTTATTPRVAVDPPCAHAPFVRRDIAPDDPVTFESPHVVAPRAGGHGQAGQKRKQRGGVGKEAAKHAAPIPSGGTRSHPKAGLNENGKGPFVRGGTAAPRTSRIAAAQPAGSIGTTPQGTYGAEGVINRGRRGSLKGQQTSVKRGTTAQSLPNYGGTLYNASQAAFAMRLRLKRGNLQLTCPEPTAFRNVDSPMPRVRATSGTLISDRAL
jgi:hypothetical protein